MIVKNEAFVCIHCKKHVAPASQTCRNHCPYCFTSLHVDGAIPGDRNTQCGGVMLPYESMYKHGEDRIHFICLSCKKTHRNKVANDDDLGVLDLKIQEYKIKTFMVV
jgi:DNA-directed RNA polymerase subunit RPC12/RpoP